jgi:hypothetical protein
MNIEEAKDIHSSRNWEIICSEIDKNIQSCVEKLRIVSAEGLLLLQHEIKMWEKFKRLPQDVIDREE